MAGCSLSERRRFALRKRQMTESTGTAIDPEPIDPTRILKEPVNHLSLGVVIFDGKRDVMFCNKRHMHIYGLSPEQVKPGTPISVLIRHPLNLGFKLLS